MYGSWEDPLFDSEDIMKKILLDFTIYDKREWFKNLLKMSD